MEKVTLTLLEALKQALALPAEQRLFRSGKLPGLFTSRSSAHTEAAERAIQEGLLEVVRSETRGKTLVQWVRPTPAAIEFLHTHEAPIAALRELRLELQLTQQGVPQWLEQMQQQMQDCTSQLLTQVQILTHRLAVLSQRVEDALARAEAAQPQLPDPLIQAVPWARQVLVYLDQRDATRPGPCPLSELFLAIRSEHPALTIAEYHSGLRRLADRCFVRLLSLAEGGGVCPEPEYALLDGLHTYYFASRAAG